MKCAVIRLLWLMYWPKPIRIYFLFFLPLRVLTVGNASFFLWEPRTARLIIWTSQIRWHVVQNEIENYCGIIYLINGRGRANAHRFTSRAATLRANWTQRWRVAKKTKKVQIRLKTKSYEIRGRTHTKKMFKKYHYSVESHFMVNFI